MCSAAKPPSTFMLGSSNGEMSMSRMSGQPSNAADFGDEILAGLAGGIVDSQYRPHAAALLRQDPLHALTQPESHVSIERPGGFDRWRARSKRNLVGNAVHPQAGLIVARGSRPWPSGGLPLILNWLCTPPVTFRFDAIASK